MSNIPTILDTEQDSDLVLDGYSVLPNRVFDDQSILSTKFYEYLRVIVIARNYGECSRQSSDDEKTTDRSVRWLF